MTSEAAESDDALVGRALEDPEAFAPIVERFQGRIFGYLLRTTGDATTAEELAQETFVRAWRSLGTFKAGARLSPWLHTIAHNLAISRHKAQRPADSLDDDGAPAVTSPIGNPEREALAHERESAVMGALAALPDDYRQVMLLRHVSGLSYQEIADTLGVPLGTVKTWLFRAREQLVARLGAEVT